MEQKIVYLDQYPFDKCYNACSRYKSSIAWATINEEIKRNKSASFEVSDCLDIFEHLQLDENYVLICYVSSAYHGMWGRVAAIPKAHKEEAREVMEDNGFSDLRLRLPELAAPPMEAIYNDGSAEGYLEALLCEQLLWSIPYYQSGCASPKGILTSPPKDLGKNWNVTIDIPDWRPRAIFIGEEVRMFNACTIILFNREYSFPMAPSDGKDTITLEEYTFPENLWFYHRMKLLKKDLTDMYHSQVEGKLRYKEGKCCCISDCNPILIAKQK